MTVDKEMDHITMLGIELDEALSVRAVSKGTVCTSPSFASTADANTPPNEALDQESLVTEDTTEYPSGIALFMIILAVVMTMFLVCASIIMSNFSDNN
jgi:hypothetical protein